ncbi:MAG: uroporphyrinogen decarboxylase family protein, partial [bacterium]
IERELLNGYDLLIEEGILHLAKTERGRLFKITAKMAVEAARFAFHLRNMLSQAGHYGEYALGVVSHPADLLAMWRGFDNFMLDLAGDPQKVKAACECLLDGFIEVGEATARLAGGKRILVGASRISGSFISPKMFEELFFESFLEIVNRLHRDGFSIMFHLDNDYTPLLDYFLEFPKKCGIMHLDQTDLYHAKEVIGNHLCLMGNLHPGLLANGKPEEVEAECERLIKEVGAGGGFILANACEVPINTPFENLHALKRAVEKWGWYR